MKASRIALMIATLFCLVAAGVVVAVSQKGSEQSAREQRLAAQLLSDDKQSQQAAVGAVRRLPPEQVGAPVRAALISLLARYNQLEDDARARGVSVEEDPELIANVEHAAADLKDRAAIPALAAAMGRTFITVRPLAQFGEPAAPYVLEVVESATSHYSAVYEGLIILRFMVEKQRERPLSPQTLDRIRRAARTRLTGQQYFTVLWKAMDLAAVLDDRQSTALLTDLATNREEAVVRGVSDPSLAEKTQQLAKQLLAGEPPRPRADF